MFAEHFVDFEVLSGKTHKNEWVRLYHSAQLDLEVLLVTLYNTGVEDHAAVGLLVLLGRNKACLLCLCFNFDVGRLEKNVSK